MLAGLFILIFCLTPVAIGAWMLQRLWMTPRPPLQPGWAALGVWGALLLVSLVVLGVLAGGHPSASPGVKTLAEIYLGFVAAVCVGLVWNLCRKPRARSD